MNWLIEYKRRSEEVAIARKPFTWTCLFYHSTHLVGYLSVSGQA